jgi:anhydro-N-acetylmuramic acid kinase
MDSNPIIYGLMSGTSLDGVDIAVCTFQRRKSQWNFKITYCTTIAYDHNWTSKLSEAHLLGGERLIALDREYGDYLGLLVNKITHKTGFQPFLVASHGHTIFHSPEKGYTLQIGSGANIAARTRCPVVCDFRSADIALGGQGAPLVPIGDKLLFAKYDGCLNLGGFANISFDRQGYRKAFDICPVNIVLNRFARLKSLKYDQDGNLGRAGSVNAALLDRLNSISFYALSFPKSLSREWIESEFDPIVKSSDCSFEDKIRTCYEHIVRQIGNVLNDNNIRNILVTGGGAHNSLLVELLKQVAACDIIIPEVETIDFKEALIFALMGWMRFQGEINCLSSVTGASTDSVCGALYVV